MLRGADHRRWKSQTIIAGCETPTSLSLHLRTHGAYAVRPEPVQRLDLDADVCQMLEPGMP